jgi:hypothetical protein
VKCLTTKKKSQLFDYINKFRVKCLTTEQIQSEVFDYRNQ